MKVAKTHIQTCKVANMHTKVSNTLRVFSGEHFETSQKSVTFPYNVGNDFNSLMFTEFSRFSSYTRASKIERLYGKCAGRTFQFKFWHEASPFITVIVEKFSHNERMYFPENAEVIWIARQFVTLSLNDVQLREFLQEGF